MRLARLILLLNALGPWLFAYKDWVASGTSNRGNEHAKKGFVGHKTGCLTAGEEGLLVHFFLQIVARESPTNATAFGVYSKTKPVWICDITWHAQ